MKTWTPAQSPIGAGPRGRGIAGGRAFAAALAEALQLAAGLIT